MTQSRGVVFFFISWVTRKNFASSYLAKWADFQFLKWLTVSVFQNPIFASFEPLSTQNAIFTKISNKTPWIFFFFSWFLFWCLQWGLGWFCIDFLCCVWLGFFLVFGDFCWLFLEISMGFTSGLMGFERVIFMCFFVAFSGDLQWDFGIVLLDSEIWLGIFS